MCPCKGKWALKSDKKQNTFYMYLFFNVSQCFLSNQTFSSNIRPFQTLVKPWLKSPLNLKKVGQVNISCGQVHIFVKLAHGQVEKIHISTPLVQIMIYDICYHEYMYVDISRWLWWNSSYNTWDSLFQNMWVPGTHHNQIQNESLVFYS